MSSPVGEICSNSLWITPKPINDLDRKLALNNGTTLLVDYATKDLLPVCHEMLQEAAKRGKIIYYSSSVLFNVCSGVYQAGTFDHSPI